MPSRGTGRTDLAERQGLYQDITAVPEISLIAVQPEAVIITGVVALPEVSAQTGVLIEHPLPEIQGFPDLPLPPEVQVEAGCPEVPVTGVPVVVPGVQEVTEVPVVVPEVLAAVPEVREAPPDLQVAADLHQAEVVEGEIKSSN